MFTVTVILNWVSILNFNHALGKADNSNMMQKPGFLWMSLQIRYEENKNAKIYIGENGLIVKSLLTNFFFFYRWEVKRIKHSCPVQATRAFSPKEQSQRGQGDRLLPKQTTAGWELALPFLPSPSPSPGARTVPHCTVREASPTADQPAQKVPTGVRGMCAVRDVLSACSPGNVQLFRAFSISLTSLFKTTQ